MGKIYCTKHGWNIGMLVSKLVAEALGHSDEAMEIREVVVKQEEVEIQAHIRERDLENYETLLGLPFDAENWAQIGDDDFDTMNSFLSTLTIACPICLRERLTLQRQ